MSMRISIMISHKLDQLSELIGKEEEQEEMARTRARVKPEWTGVRDSVLSRGRSRQSALVYCVVYHYKAKGARSEPSPVGFPLLSDWPRSVYRGRGRHRVVPPNRTTLK